MIYFVGLMGLPWDTIIRFFMSEKCIDCGKQIKNLGGAVSEAYGRYKIKSDNRIIFTGFVCNKCIFKGMTSEQKKELWSNVR